MEVMIINQAEVSDLMPMDECIEVMADALKSLAGGKDILPLRPVMWLPDKKGALGLMPAYSNDLKIMGVKAVSVFPDNAGTTYDSHMGTVLIYETEHGTLLAIVDAGEITAIRTAATSGVATRLLASKDAQNLSILGSGIQARSHLDAMLAVRDIKQVSIWSRNADNAQRFVEQARQEHDILFHVADTAEEAVSKADIICTTTAAPEPILLGKWIAPGTHINAVGSSIASTRELDTAAMLNGHLFVDRRESTLNESGDFLIPKKEGAFSDDHILGEIGEVILGKATGRVSSTDITIFKSLGLAIEDIASATHIYRQAKVKGFGTMIELGGARHP